MCQIASWWMHLLNIQITMHSNCSISKYPIQSPPADLGQTVYKYQQSCAPEPEDRTQSHLHIIHRNRWHNNGTWHARTFLRRRQRSMIEHVHTHTHEKCTLAQHDAHAQYKRLLRSLKRARSHISPGRVRHITWYCICVRSVALATSKMHQTEWLHAARTCTTTSGGIQKRICMPHVWLSDSELKNYAGWPCSHCGARTHRASKRILYGIRVLGIVLLD